jgi:hypothetical protein
MPKKKTNATNYARQTYKGESRSVLVRIRVKERVTDPLYAKHVEDMLLDCCSDILVVEDVSFPDGMYGDNGEFEDE